MRLYLIPHDNRHAPHAPLAPRWLRRGPMRSRFWRGSSCSQRRRPGSRNRFEARTSSRRPTSSARSALTAPPSAPIFSCRCARQASHTAASASDVARALSNPPKSAGWCGPEPAGHVGSSCHCVNKHGSLTGYAEGLHRTGCSTLAARAVGGLFGQYDYCFVLPPWRQPTSFSEVPS
jgi:hypothetical protein